MRYFVDVDYQTQTGGNTAHILINAKTEEQAIELAHEKVRRDRRRNVVQIDGGSISQASG